MLTRVRLVGAVLAIIGVCATSAAQGTDKTDHEIKSATLSRIFAAWKAREEPIKSFRVSWDSRIILPKSVPRPVEPLLAGLETRDNGSGGEKLEYTLPGSELWGEGPNRLRDDFLVVRNMGENAWERIARVRNVVNGASHFRLMVPLISGDCAMATVWREFEAKNAEAVPAALRARPEFSGAVGELGPHWRAREIDLLPLLLAFRPSNPLCAIASMPWHVMSENAIVEQVHCVKLQAIPSSDDNRPRRFARFNSPAYNSDTCWVDPSRDYVVVLWESKRPGRPDISVAIDYRHDPPRGWIPSGWRRPLASRRPGIAGTVDATVTRCAVNETLPAGTFARDFPAGTQICDVTVDEQVGAKLATESASPIPKRDATRDAIVAAWTRQRSRIRSYRIAWEPEWIRPYRDVPDFSAEKDRARKKEGAKKAVIHPIGSRRKRPTTSCSSSKTRTATGVRTSARPLPAICKIRRDSSSGEAE
jgi:hypothetical protein